MRSVLQGERMTDGKDEKPMRILNLYAGIGGNRKLWGGAIEVTAVEIDPLIAEVYKKNFPQDQVVIGDAKEYLLHHFKEFDFIWASPPCPTHSRMRTLWKGEGKLENKTSGSSFKLPDMDLYSIIIFLQHFYEGVWVVENVVSYYDPLIQPYLIDNHYFWSNRNLGTKNPKSRNILSQDLEAKAKKLKIDMPDVDASERTLRKMINNCVKPEIGLFVFNQCFKSKQMVLNYGN